MVFFLHLIIYRQKDNVQYFYAYFPGKGISQFVNMPTFMQSIRKFASDNLFELRDVAPDGNCMFRAIADQLHINGDLGYNWKILRRQAVRQLLCTNTISLQYIFSIKELQHLSESMIILLLNKNNQLCYIILTAAVTVMLFQIPAA